MLIQIVKVVVDIIVQAPPPNESMSIDVKEARLSQRSPLAPAEGGRGGPGVEPFDLTLVYGWITYRSHHVAIDFHNLIIQQKTTQTLGHGRTKRPDLRSFGMQPTIPRGGDAQFGPGLRHVHHIVEHGILAQYAQIGPFQPRSILEDESHGVQQPTSRAAHRQLGAMSVYGPAAQHGAKGRVASTSQRDASQQQVVSRMGKFDDGGVGV
mmetsp:Transcript_30755/g.56885  ORF Transcript_30755/g.56885 Transcript_30755/m.56885 type:complete len:209 (-) Transcript_30755:333-959(-)